MLCWVPTGADRKQSFIHSLIYWRLKVISTLKNDYILVWFTYCSSPWGWGCFHSLWIGVCAPWRVSNLENWYPVKAQTQKLAPYSKEKQTLGIAWMVRLYFVSVAFKANQRCSSYRSFVFRLARHVSTGNLADSIYVSHYSGSMFPTRAKMIPYIY